jgi:hypothetical protein
MYGRFLVMLEVSTTVLNRDKEDLHGKRALGYEPTLHRPWVPQRIFRRA